MAGSFDPYREWLGIAPHERPLHYYRLLGLNLYEQDTARIAQAADERITEVRKWQQGTHASASQRIVTELAQARVCLLDPAKRRLYDEKLSAALNGQALPPVVATVASPPPPPPLPPAPKPASPWGAPPAMYVIPPPAPNDGEMPPWILPTVLGSGLAVLLLLVVGFLLQASFSGGEPRPFDQAMVEPKPELTPPVIDPAMPEGDLETTEEPLTTPDQLTAPPEPPPGLPATIAESINRWGKPDTIATEPSNPWGKSGLPQAAIASDVIVTGDDDQWTSTTGLQGELTLGGQPSGVILHYRLGATLDVDAINRQCASLGVNARAPDGSFVGRLVGRLEVRRATKVTFTQHATFTQASLTLDGLDTMPTNVLSRSENQVTTAQYDLSPGTYPLTWDIGGSGTQEGTLRIAATDPTAIVVGYTTSDSDRLRARNDVGELLVARNLQRTQAGKGSPAPLTSALTPKVAPGSPEAGPAADPTMPGKRRLRPATPVVLPGLAELANARAVVTERYQAECDAAQQNMNFLPLGRKLINDAEHTPDLATRHAMFELALDIYVQTAHYEYVDSCFATMRRHFVLDDFEERQYERYSQLIVPEEDRAEQARFARRCGALAIDCLKKNRDLAQQWVDLGIDAADLSGNQIVQRDLNAIEERVLNGE